jgi:hypothetical protein
MIEGCYLLRRAEAQRLQRSHPNLVLADIYRRVWRISEAFGQQVMPLPSCAPSRTLLGRTRCDASQ